MVSFLRRDSKDLFVKLLTQQNLSLLRPPSEKEAVGDLHVYSRGKTSTQGKITYLLDPPLAMPSLVRESLPDFAGSTAATMSFKEGFSIFEGIFNALKIGGESGRAKVNYERAKAKKIKFGFSNVTKERVDVFELGSRLEAPEFRVKNPFYDGKSEYHLVTAVARSPSFTIRVEDQGGQALSAGVQLPKIVKSTTKLSVKENSENEIVTKGKKLVFGIQTYQMRYDPQMQKLSFLPSGIIKVGANEKPDYRPSFIGGPNTIFVDLG
jgi:hypothetical protein